ncbi:hypothetical protein V8E36_001861 [Tilletia maclaganii]
MTMSSYHAFEADPHATVRSSHSNRKARTPMLPSSAAAARSKDFTPFTSPSLRPASPTPSSCSVSSSTSSSTSSFKRRRTSVDSETTTDWTGSMPRTNAVSTTAAVVSSRQSAMSEPVAALLPGGKKHRRAPLISARQAKAERAQAASASESAAAPPSDPLGRAQPAHPDQRWSTWTADSTLHSEFVWGCSCQSSQMTGAPPQCHSCEGSEPRSAARTERSGSLDHRRAWEGSQDRKHALLLADEHRRIAQKTVRPSSYRSGVFHSRSHSSSSNHHVEALPDAACPAGNAAISFADDAATALSDIRSQLSRVDDDHDDDAAEQSDPAQRAAFEQLFRATVAALEQSNALLLSTLNSRSQLASLRAQQGAVERDMNARETELNRRLEANRSMSAWVQESADQLAALVRELDADRLRAAGGVAAPSSSGAGAGGWGFARPTHWRVPSLSGLGSVFSAAEESSGASSGGPSSSSSSGGGGTNPSLDADGNLTIGKTAAKRLERVLIKHKRGQSSLSIASSMQGQVGHARTTSMASSRLAETPVLPQSTIEDGSTTKTRSRATSPASSPLCKMADLAEEDPKVGDAPDGHDHPIGDAGPQAKSASRAPAARAAETPVIPETPKMSATPSTRPSRIVRPGKSGLGLRLGPSAPITATTAHTSPTVVVSPSQDPSYDSRPRNSLSTLRTESRASLTSIDENESGAAAAHRAASRGRFPIGASPSPAPVSPTVDRCVSPALSLNLSLEPRARRRPGSQRGSISSLNSVNSARSERVAASSVTGSPFAKQPRALAAALTMSAPASRLEVPTVLSTTPAWSSSELAPSPSGLPAPGPSANGASGALDTLSALLSRSPSSMSRSASRTSASHVSVSAEQSPAHGTPELGQDADSSSGEDGGEQYAEYLRQAASTHEHTRSAITPLVPLRPDADPAIATARASATAPSPIMVDSRRLSSQSNASRISHLSMTANLRSPRLARLDSNTASALAAQASAELASGRGGGASASSDGPFGAQREGEGAGTAEGGGGGASGAGAGRGALAALKRLNEQKAVLPGGPEVDGRVLADSGAGAIGSGAWASLTSWVGLGLGGGASRAHSQAGGDEEAAPVPTTPDTSDGGPAAESAPTGTA